MNITVVFATLCSLFSNGPVPAPHPGAIQADYVEARTASVYAGACHFNGELMTTGRDAVMAWNFNTGSWKGVDLSGVRAMAAVSSDDNFYNTSAPRRAEIVIDSAATSAQAAAVVDALKSRCGDALGNVVAVHRTAI